MKFSIYTDLFSQHWFPIVLLFVLVTRLPFLWNGYGADADAWSVANAASVIWKTGTYTESRLPGYPLHEILTSILISAGGSVLSNAGTLFATLLAVFIWYKILQQIGNYKKTLVCAFAFAPVIWQNSAVTLDYMWSLLFILISFYAALHRQILIAGIALGIAAGFRLSNLLALFPLLVLLHLQKYHRPQLVKVAATALVVSMLCFLPLIIKYGIPGWFLETQREMSDVHPQLLFRFIAFFYRTIYFFGLPAFIVLIVIFWRKKNDIAVSIRLREPIVVTSIAGIAGFLFLFLWLPLERAYLLPLLPFVLLLIDKFSSQQLALSFTTLLLFSGFINIDVIKADDRRAIGLNIHPGMVIEEFQLRKKLLQERNQIPAIELSSKSLVITGKGPEFWFENSFVETASDSLLIHSLHFSKEPFKLVQQKKNPDIFYAAFLKKDEIAFLRHSGYNLFYISDQKKRIESIVNYSLDSAGFKPVLIMPQ